MKLIGQILIETRIVKEAVVVNDDPTASFRDLLEKCLVDVCRALDIPVPLWLGKNTNEFVAYRRTFFSSEQFIEKVYFDKFEIRMES